MSEDINDVREDTIEIPKFIEKAKHPKISIAVLDLWSELLWQATAWSVFLFNFVVVIYFLWDIINSNYDPIKHIAISLTMCVSYFILTWTHTNILRRNDDGRFD